MLKKFCATLPLLCFFLLFAQQRLSDAADTAQGKPAEVIRSGSGEVTELWSGKVLSASFKAGMCFDAQGKARGVLKLRHANGQVDVYHLYGTIRDNQFDLAHSSGHFFSGRLNEPLRMSGQVRLRNGLKLSLEGQRELDAPLLRSDCAPLD